MPLAFFDLDRTLICRRSAEGIFLAQAVRRGLLPPWCLLWNVVEVVRRPGWLGEVRRWLDRHPGGPFGWSAALRYVLVSGNKMYLRGGEVASLEALAREVVAEVTLPRIAPAGRERIAWHRDQGHRVILLTGAPDFLAEPVARHLGIQEVICLELERRDGRFTGRLASPHPYGERKATLALERCRSLGEDPGEAYAYGDHVTDGALLAAVGHPVAVNPSRALERLARVRGWPVERWCG